MKSLEGSSNRAETRERPQETPRPPIAASFLADEAWREVGPGGRVFCPRTSVHTFKNNSDAPLHRLLTTAPAGFENFFAQCAAEFANSAGPDMERILAIAAAHGIEFANP